MQGDKEATSDTTYCINSSLTTRGWPALGTRFTVTWQCFSTIVVWMKSNVVTGHLPSSEACNWQWLEWHIIVVQQTAEHLSTETNFQRIQSALCTHCVTLIYPYPLNQLLHGIISQNKTPKDLCQQPWGPTILNLQHVCMWTQLRIRYIVSSLTPFNLAGSMSSIDHKK